MNALEEGLFDGARIPEMFRGKNVRLGPDEDV
jgi:hypothetical protein